jgi:hypothetical protein
VEPTGIDFRMVDGRVYHQGLAFAVGDTHLRTHGSVGLDQTLAIMVETPVRDDWIRDVPLLQGLKDQTIRVPVHGTFARPMIDRRVLAQLSAQLVNRAAERAVGDALNKQLEKLFRPRR